MSFDRDVFFDAVRSAPGSGSLTQSQVDGFDAILSTWEADPELTDLRWLAYMLATSWHETAFTMEPITEYGSQSYLEGKDYYPYIGRGFVQLTWEDNYRRATEELELSGSDDLVKYPDRALDPEIASEVMFQGMVQGWFTGKALDDYFNDAVDDPYNARRIINGTDCADQIKGYHKAFLSALEDAWVETPAVPSEVATVTISVESEVPIRLVIARGVNVVEVIA